MDAPRTFQSPRIGDWMQTYTGRQFWPLDPRVEEIDIEDIAHALSMACRYAGHCNRFYSVAEHSVLMADKIAGPFKRWALLHDASEAYLVDVPRPLKPFLPGYYEMEARVMAVICERFGLPVDMPAEVKAADSSILVDEREQNMSQCDADWNLPHQPLGVRVMNLPPDQIEYQFLDTFRELFPEHC